MMIAMGSAAQPAAMRVTEGAITKWIRCRKLGMQQGRLFRPRSQRAENRNDGVATGGESDVDNLKDLKEFYDWRKENSDQSEDDPYEASARALAVILYEGERGRGAEAIQEAIANGQINEEMFRVLNKRIDLAEQENDLGWAQGLRVLEKALKSALAVAEAPPVLRHLEEIMSLLQAGEKNAASEAIHQFRAERIPRLDSTGVVDVFGVAAALVEDRERFERDILLEEEESEKIIKAGGDISREELAAAAEDALRNIDDAGRPTDVSENEFEEIRENLLWVAKTARGV